MKSTKKKNTGGSTVKLDTGNLLLLFIAYGLCTKIFIRINV